ncbi:MULTISPECIES: hypothetical protein [Gordonibacter]|uniref:Uncharacterized protein n=1 Tax=Gordonibacter faecis TaxID=3047475 RepID=A0ABT7DLX1_9ACTN|nr:MULTISPECIES: hypothetical protein [unclassified Gordonibacter]MDJ1650532.1 hypothetical protein [Gordonibacter sp. KGMB12511]HIW76404.1 hypothetical protein [Candidatus Gordonibacter avicola]
MDGLESPGKNTISQSRLVAEAQSLPFDKRKNIIADQPETTLHKHLKVLFSSMDSNLEVLLMDLMN